MNVKLIKGLYAIADDKWNPYSTMSELVEKFLMGGCKLVQIRMKGAAKEKYLKTAREIMNLKSRYDFTFIINDHADVAIEVGADGVHVGENDSPVSKIKSEYGDKLIVGYSSHSADEAISAATDGADYVAIGAVFETKTKGPGHPVQGLEKLAEVVGSVDVPVVAIGGIGHDNIADVIKTGADSVAMITSLSQADDIVESTKKLVSRLSCHPVIRD